MNRFENAILAAFPGWAASRARSRIVATHLARHYEAAQSGRRTDNWPRKHGDANVMVGPALTTVRAHVRDLIRNNGWAKNGHRVIGRKVVGWGIMGRPMSGGSRTKKRSRELWNEWAGSTQCDWNGALTMGGLQRQWIDAISESGEVLVRKRMRPLTDGLVIPLQLQTLEADFLDSNKDGITTEGGGRIIQGKEYTKAGKLSHYWLFEEHPGASYMPGSRIASVSKRIPASEILHGYRIDRPGQVRGISWFAPAVLTFKDFDEYEDAKLVQQKIAACLTVFVTDVNGVPMQLGEKTDPSKPLIETLEPGMVVGIPPGRDVKFADPPSAGDSKPFSDLQLRKLASAMGITYEDFTGDYSNSNWHSSRTARLNAFENVQDWRWNMLIPQMCMPVWRWAMEAAFIAGELQEIPTSGWTPPPMPMLDPDKEGIAIQRLVRNGALNPDEMVRQQGEDPDTYWQEYADALARIDALKLILDCDPRLTTQQGGPRDPKQQPGTPPKDDKEEDTEADRALADALRTLSGSRANPA